MFCRCHDRSGNQFKKIASSGKQIIGITFVQSIGTFFVVSAVFSVVFLIAGIPIDIAFVFGGIALATAPKTLIPLAAIDDIIGVIVFFTVAAAIINEIIAVIVAKVAFRLAGEIKE